MTSADLTPLKEQFWSPFALRQAWLTIDQNSSAIAFVRSMTGTIALHIAFILILAMSRQISTSALGLISATLLAVALLPAKRMMIICFSSLFYLAMRPFRIDGWSTLLSEKAAFLPSGIPALGLQIGAVIAFLAVAAGFLNWQRNNKDHVAAKRPIVALMIAWSATTLLAWSLPAQSISSSILWVFSGVWISSFWYLAYAAAGSKNQRRNANIGSCFPNASFLGR